VLLYIARVSLAGADPQHIAVGAGGVPDCVGNAAQIHGGVYWACAVWQLHPQDVGQIRFDILRPALRKS
jgi:hypothetical protein